MVSDWVLEPALVTVNVEGTLENKVLPMRLVRLAGDEIAYEAVSLPLSGCLLESISTTVDLGLCVLLYVGVMAEVF